MPPILLLGLAIFIEFTPPEFSLFILDESIESSLRTAAKITFLIRFSSVVKVSKASLELFSKFWHLCFSSMLFSILRRVKLAKLGLFIRTPISKFVSLFNPCFAICCARVSYVSGTKANSSKSCILSTPS